MEKRKRGRPVGSAGKPNKARVLFRERWNRAFSKLSAGEAKRYTAIIQTTRILCGLEELPKNQIYLVRKGQNNKNFEVLKALEQYVEIK